LKKNLLFFFYLIAGIIIGSLIAAVSLQASWLNWLSFGIEVGFGSPNPAVLDLAVLRIAFGISLDITVAHVICIGIAIFLYNRRGARR